MPCMHRNLKQVLLVVGCFLVQYRVVRAQAGTLAISKAALLFRFNGEGDPVQPHEHST